MQSGANPCSIVDLEGESGGRAQACPALEDLGFGSRLPATFRSPDKGEPRLRGVRRGSGECDEATRVIKINLVDQGRHTGPSPNPTHDWRQVVCFWGGGRKN